MTQGFVGVRVKMPAHSPNLTKSLRITLAARPNLTIVGAQFLRFILVGGISALADLCLVWIILKNHGGYIPAVSVGFFAGLIVNYLLHSSYTFKSCFMNSSRLFKFVVVVGLNYLLTVSIVWFLLNFLSVPILIAKVVSLPIIAVNGYYWSRNWVFY